MFNLPIDVLHLFPTWEYQCPKCQIYVELPINFCPKCMLPFNEEKWRVPPHFLKSHGAMSDYAHKTLAPKLTETQRKLLFKYFTVILSDGFETSSPPNFDAGIWDVDTGGSGTCISETNNPNSGTKNLKATSAASGDWAEVIHTFSANDPTYVREYVKFASYSITNNDSYIYVLDISDATYGYLTAAAIYKSGGVIYWGIFRMENSVSAYILSDATPATGTWYCVELKRDVANDVQSLWINTEMEANSVGAITTNPTLTDIGIGYQQGAGGCVMYIDDVVIADAPIGPISGDGETLPIYSGQNDGLSWEVTY